MRWAKNKSRERREGHKARERRCNINNGDWTQEKRLDRLRGKGRGVRDGMMVGKDTATAIHSSQGSGANTVIQILTLIPAVSQFIIFSWEEIGANPR